MPDAKNNAKLTGDTHPPELEDAKGSPQGLEDTEDAGGDARDTGRKTGQAGHGKDKDAPGLGHGKA